MDNQLVVKRHFMVGNKAILLILDLDYTITIVFQIDENGNWIGIEEIIWKSGDEVLLQYFVEGTKTSSTVNPKTIKHIKPYVRQSGFFNFIEASLKYLKQIMTESKDEKLKRDLKNILDRYSLADFVWLRLNMAPIHNY